MDNNNNTQMKYNDEKERKKQEIKDKVESVKRKFTEKFNTVKSDMADFKEEYDTKKRIKNQEKMDKAKQKAMEKGIPTDSYSDVQTITNETIQHSTGSKPNKKSKKRELTEQEKRQKKQKRSRIIRNIMTIPEIILIVLLVIFLKDKYVAYSKDVHQTLIYKADRYIYEIKRDNNDINVVKKVEVECIKAPCEAVEDSKYPIKFSKSQMTIIRTYFDTIFTLKSKTKEVEIKDINSEVGLRSIRSIIHNDSKFLNAKIFKDYQIIDYEQMSSNEDMGYIYEEKDDKYYLTIAMGPRSSGGYSLVISEVHNDGKDLTFYVKEQNPEKGENTTQVITHPSVRVQLNEKPGDIKVYNIDSGEEYPKYK